jgi:DNA-binding LacI/PurR family transcriptional regulator
MTYITNGTIGTKLTSLTTEPEFEVGAKVLGSDGTEWVYVQASGAITAYDYVCMDENYQAAAGTKALIDAGHAIAFAQVAFADNDYGWVALKGSNISVRVKTACQPDTTLYTSGVAGIMDDTASGHTRIDGVVIISTAAATGAKEVIASYPCVGVTI